MTIVIPASALPWLWFGCGYIVGFLTLLLVAFIATRKPNARRG